MDDTTTLHTSHDIAVLDISGLTCPMTFVRTRLAIDALPPGATLRVKLRGQEPRENVPRMASHLGHTIVSMQDEPDGVSVLELRTKASPPE